MIHNQGMQPRQSPGHCRSQEDQTRLLGQGRVREPSAAVSSRGEEGGLGGAVGAQEKPS